MSTGTPFSSITGVPCLFSPALWKGWPSGTVADKAIELVEIRTAQELATRERPNDSLTSMGTMFVNLKHNTPTIDGSTFVPAFQASSSHTIIQFPPYHDIAPGGPPQMMLPLSHLHILGEAPCW